MGLKRMMLRVRTIDFLMLMFCLIFLASIIMMNLVLNTHDTVKPGLNKVLDTEPGDIRIARRAERVKRDVSDSWSIPADPNPVVLGVPWDCSTPTILNEFVNGTCFGHCNAASCGSDTIASIQSGNSELVCTAKIILLGFKRTGTYDISRWIKQHPDVTAKNGDMFIDSSGHVVFETCPVPQLRDSSNSYYFNPYSIDSINGGQKVNYLHCENCLTTAYTDLYFGSLFLDLPTGMFQFFSSSSQRFIITLKNPTDRAIAEYFYPHIRAGTDLNTVGGQTLHDAMTAAIAQVQACMQELGPTACVYGVIPSSMSSADVLAESTMLYESCYSTHLNQIVQQLSTSQVYFMKIEEYQANPYSTIQDLYNFIGLEYAGPITLPTGHVSKPILQATIDMMDAFFAPFNEELSSLLGNTKWLYIRS